MLRATIKGHRTLKDCNQCGKCCQKYGGGGLSATPEDIDWWHAHRPEIAKYTHRGNIWMDPETGAQLGGCPWLRKVDGKDMYTCDIYFDRPDDCRQYPTLVSDMIKDDCEMIEVTDLASPKRAQNQLDLLMDRG